MFFIDTVELTGLGNRHCLAGGPRTAVAVDPPRDIDQVLAAAARRGVRITHVAETHLHNDYVTGGLRLARVTGAAYLVPAGAPVAFARVPVTDGDTVTVDSGLGLRAVATPGHTPHHTAYVLSERERPVAVFTGGSLLIGTVGRPDLVEPRLTERLARTQYTSAHRLRGRRPHADRHPRLTPHDPRPPSPIHRHSRQERPLPSPGATDTQGTSAPWPCPPPSTPTRYATACTS